LKEAAKLATAIANFRLHNSHFIDAAKGPTVWAALARKMGPQALGMNLNTLLRHDVFRVEQLSSTACADGEHERLGQSFYTGVAEVEVMEL